MPDLFGAVADHEPDHGPARLTSIRPTPVVMSTADKSSPRCVLPRDLSDALRQLDDLSWIGLLWLPAMSSNDAADR